MTVSDPARPADLLVSGDEEPRPSPFTRRRLQAVAALALVGALAAGAVELRERRAAAAEQRRLDRVLDLRVEPEGDLSSYDEGSGVATLDLQLRLHNDGPRDLVVERGTAGSYVLVQTAVEVTAGGEAPLQLRREVTCTPTAPPPRVSLPALSLELRTAAGPRQVALPLDEDLLGDEAARVCGFVPLEEAVEVELLGAARPAGALELALELASRSIEAVSLAAVDAGPGLRVSVRESSGGPVSLPLRLPPRPGFGSRQTTSLEVRLEVTDCTSARTALPQLELRVVDENGRTGQPLVGYDPAFLGTLLSAACPS